jgi:hypothetical protein
MPANTILCGKKGSAKAVRIVDYLGWEQETDHGWSRKPTFIRCRLFERYIDPVWALDSNLDTKAKKNGFYVMAVSCLLIETLVAFCRGWETTEPHRDSSGRKVKGRSRKAFEFFFRTQPRFSAFKSSEFYKHVRCGILHQGETTGGWTIERKGLLFDGVKCINATRFHNELASAVDDYVAVLRNPPNNSKYRKNFDKKMRAVIKNCG